jgi:hypothetical protein
MAFTEVVIKLIRYVTSFRLERLCFIPEMVKRHTLRMSGTLMAAVNA